MDNIGAQLRRCEQALLDPAVRRDRTQVEDLLAEDFMEFGSSGRIWSRDQIFELLETETYTPVLLEDFECTLLSEEVALVTYRAVTAFGTRNASRTQNASLRSSIWTKRLGRWRLRFHQGTRQP